MREEAGKGEGWTEQERYVLKRVAEKQENIFKLESRTNDLIAVVDRRTWWSGLSDRTKNLLAMIAKIAGTVLATLGILEIINRHGSGPPTGHP